MNSAMEVVKSYIPRWLTDPYGGFRYVFVPAFGFVAVSCALLFASAYWIVSTTCKAQGEAMRIDVQWGVWTGCMININGQLLPWSEVVPVERGGKIEFIPKPVIRLQSKN